MLLGSISTATLVAYGEETTDSSSREERVSSTETVSSTVTSNADTNETQTSSLQKYRRHRNHFRCTKINIAVKIVKPRV